jgi:choline dehydrogenase-like flavoprotein
MGSADDPMSVVSPELRVHGIDNLRIADASVMPLMTSGNTNAPAMMIGYRCADFVRDGRATADGRRRPVETASMRQERPASTPP